MAMFLQRSFLGWLLAHLLLGFALVLALILHPELFDTPLGKILLGGLAATGAKTMFHAILHLRFDRRNSGFIIGCVHFDAHPLDKEKLCADCQLFDGTECHDRRHCTLPRVSTRTSSNHERKI